MVINLLKKSNLTMWIPLIGLLGGTQRTKHALCVTNSTGKYCSILVLCVPTLTYCKTLWKTMHHNEGRRGTSLSRSLSLTYTHLIKPLDPP